VFVPFFTQCGAISYPSNRVGNLATLAALCEERHPGAGGGGH
jgi:hypothetical protein